MTDNEKTPIKWCYRPTIVIIALLTAGPFALPLVWKSPAFTKPSKIAITVLMLLLTVWLVKTSVNIYQLFMKDLQNMQNLLK